MPVALRPDPVFVRGHGSWIEDAEGRVYLDLVQGWAVNALGHAPPVVVAALAEQAARLINPSPGFLNAPLIACTERLARLTGLDQVFLCSTGAEANEGAIKLARRWGARHRDGAHRIVVVEDAFHGRTLATMCASGKPGWDALFAPPGEPVAVPGFRRVARDPSVIGAAIDATTCAVMLEPIQGEAGVIPIPDGELREIRRITRERGVLLILDEVQTGCGRTGAFLACQHAGVEPDVLTLGKGIGGGVPAAALLCTRAAMAFAPGDQGGTYAGNALIAAVVDAVTATVAEPAFLSRVGAAGDRLAAGLRRFGPVRGRGLLLAVDLLRPIGARVVDAARSRGLLINSPRPSLVRLMPALTISDAEIDEALHRLGSAIDALDHAT
jgi:acetylornithine/N-succinyldiaminopimelate aminotransferase